MSLGRCTPLLLSLLLTGCVVKVKVKRQDPEPTPAAKAPVKPAPRVVRRGNEWTVPRDNRRFGHWPSAADAAGPLANRYTAEGDQLFDQRDYLAAVEAYSRAIRLAPRQAYIYCNRGSARRRMRDFKGAIADLSQAIELRPDYALAYNNRGYAKLLAGDLGGALKDFDLALQIGEDVRKFPSYRASMTYRNRARAWRRLGKPDRARQDLRLARQLDPK